MPFLLCNIFSRFHCNAMAGLGWKTKKAATFYRNCLIFKWCHQESNRGHKDFQSFALPTELWHHRFCECKGKCFFCIMQVFVIKILQKYVVF